MRIGGRDEWIRTAISDDRMDSYKVNITKQAEESMRNISLYIAQNFMNVSAQPTKTSD